MDLDFENELQINQNHAEDNYYQEYCRLFLANIVLTNQIKELIEQKSHLKYRLSKYEDDQCYSSFERNQKAKRFRRNAHQIERFYKCTVKSCGKSYGSEGSLNQHYKLKHPDIYASLPNVQSVCESKSIDPKSEKKEPKNDFHRNSNLEVNSILKELDDIKSFKSIKIEELKYDFQESRENKQNLSHNIQERAEIKEGATETKKFTNFIKKEESLFNSIVNQEKQKLKRSSRTIKKRNFNHF